jgi:hypothetical protein
MGKRGGQGTGDGEQGTSPTDFVTRAPGFIPGQKEFTDAEHPCVLAQYQSVSLDAEHPCAPSPGLQSWDE